MCVVWHARPSQEYAPEAEKGRDGLAAIAISLHLFDQSNAFDQNLVRDIQWNLVNWNLQGMERQMRQNSKVDDLISNVRNRCRYRYRQCSFHTNSISMVRWLLYQPRRLNKGHPACLLSCVKDGTGKECWLFKDILRKKLKEFKRSNTVVGTYH